MPKLTRNDLDLHYEVGGDGPPLLLIAGMMSDGASWTPLLPLLEPDFTVIRPDNRTTGQTMPMDASVSLQHWIDDLLALIDALGTARVHVVGHSLGGMIAWALARQAPEKVGSLTLLASAPTRSARNIALFRALIAIRQSNAPEDTWLRALFPWLFGEAVFRAPGAVDLAVQQSLAYPHAQSPEAMARQLDALEAMPTDPFTHAPHVPTKAVLAGSDLLLPLAETRAALGDVAMSEIAAAGHSIHWDAPEDVARQIRAFALENRL